jgi:polysaccharide biosynthesis protein PslH
VNILFLSHRIPFPPNKGEKIRAYHMLAHLVKSHTIHLGAFVDDPADMQYAADLKSMTRGECLLVPLRRSTALPRGLMAMATGGPLTTAFFGSRRMRRWIAEVLRSRNIDRVVLFSTAMAPFLLDAADFDPARVIFDMVDVDSDKWRQYADTTTGARSWIFRREAQRLFRLERRAANAFGATLLVSPYEARAFTDLAPETKARVHAMANGVDLDYFSPTQGGARPYAAGESPVVMTGMMDYRPNIEGAIWFAKRVLPAVRAAIPDARFYIVGAKPSDSVCALASADVVVTGRVADVRPYLAHAAAVVAPLRLARGIQNKVLEGLAMARPLVATVPASRALTVTPGSDIWVEDDPARFAAAVIAAMRGPDRDRVALNGRRLVEQHYEWDNALTTLDRLLENEPRPAPVRTDVWKRASAPVEAAR